MVDGVQYAASPGFQVPLSEIIRQHLDVPTIAVGMLESPPLAEEVLKNGQADLIALGRELLRNPYWPLRAAREFGVDLEWPTAYLRAK